MTRHYTWNCPNYFLWSVTLSKPRSTFTSQVLSAKYLGSATEYRFWLMSEFRQLAKEGNAEKIRAKFEALLGPVSSGAAGQWEPKILGHDKRDLLRSALGVISGNLELQRLYSEFREQLNAAEDLKEVDEMLDIWNSAQN